MARGRGARAGRAVTEQLIYADRVGHAVALEVGGMLRWFGISWIDKAGQLVR